VDQGRYGILIQGNFTSALNDRLVDLPERIASAGIFPAFAYFELEARLRNIFQHDLPRSCRL